MLIWRPKATNHPLTVPLAGCEVRFVPTEAAYQHGSGRDRLITVRGDGPEGTVEFGAFASELFLVPPCGLETGYGLPWMETCPLPTDPASPWGHCTEHSAAIRECYVETDLCGEVK